MEQVTKIFTLNLTTPKALPPIPLYGSAHMPKREMEREAAWLLFLRTIEWRRKAKIV
jgi:hypothetical protein